MTKEPAAITTSSGHMEQSRNTVPGVSCRALAAIGPRVIAATSIAIAGAIMEVPVLM